MNFILIDLVTTTPSYLLYRLRFHTFHNNIIYTIFKSNYNKLSFELFYAIVRSGNVIQCFANLRENVWEIISIKLLTRSTLVISCKMTKCIAISYYLQFSMLLVNILMWCWRSEPLQTPLLDMYNNLNGL